MENAARAELKQLLFGLPANANTSTPAVSKLASNPMVNGNTEVEHELFELIRNNESGPKKERINSRHKLFDVRPTEFPATLLRFTTKHGEVRYFPKTPHPEREQLTGAYGHLSESRTVYRFFNNHIVAQPTAKFIKTVKPDDNLTIEQLIESAKITQKMYPGTGYMLKDNKLLIMMDRLPGKALFDLAENNSIIRLSKTDQHEIAISTVMELMRLHALGVIHRDIKPENYIIDIIHKRAFLIDFDFTQPPNECTTASGSLHFTVAELLAREITTNSAATDIFSLGLILFVIYSGRAALEAILVPDAKDITEAMQKIYLFQKNILTTDFIYQTMTHKSRAIAYLIAAICDPVPSRRMTTFDQILSVLNKQLKISQENPATLAKTGANDVLQPKVLSSINKQVAV